MPVKRISFPAVFLVFFISGLLFSCGPSKQTTSNVTKYCRLYLSAPATEKETDISDEVKKITAQLQNYIDSIVGGRKGKDTSNKYTLAYSFKTFTVDGKQMIEVQYYLVRRRVAGPGTQPPPAPLPAPQSQQDFEGADDTGHTPPPCPRPRPGIMTKYTIEGWVCD